ncbi:MAG: FlaA1/EpsC-like NDP-sugar epimerase [Maribacter sp.]|jgi:FlaA1/EpsC-like NDP-sugar epimerase
MKVFHEKLFPIGLVFFIDVLLTAFSFMVSYAICSYIVPDISSQTMLVQLPIVVAITSMIFLFIGIYKGVVKYDRIREVYSIFNAICLANILTIVLVVINGKMVMENDLMVPLSIIIVHSVFSFSALVASRYLFKKINTRFIENYSKYIPVALISAGTMNNEEIENINHFLQNSNNKLNVVLDNYTTNGSKVFENDYFSKRAISKIYILRTIDNFGFVHEVLNNLKNVDVKVKLLDKKLGIPLFSSKTLGYNDIFPSQFLNETNHDNLVDGLENKTIMITGAGGSIGGELAKKIFNLRLKATLILIDNSESSLNLIAGFLSNSSMLKVVPRLIDIKDKKLMDDIFEEYRPSIVLHAAGNTFLEFFNDNKNKIIQQNLTSTKTIADLAVIHKVKKFVFCSSNRSSKPTTTLEVSKRLAELYLDCLNQDNSITSFITLRLNQVYDTNNSTFNYIKNQTQLKKTINLKYIREQEVFTSKEDVVQQILVLCLNDKYKGVYSSVLGMKFDSEYLINLVNLIESNFSNHHSIESLKNSFIKEDIYSDDNTVSNFKSLQDSLLRVTNLNNISSNKVKQKIEHICLNILFEDNDLGPIFDLINSFGKGEWNSLYLENSKSKDNKRIIKLQTN